MAEANFDETCPDGRGVGPGIVMESLTPARRQVFGYCVECGSWGDHDLECGCCGYDFRTPSPKTTLDD